MDEFLSILKTTLEGIEGIDFNAIETQARAVTASYDAEKTRINKKNTELLGDLKKAKEKAKTAEEELSKIDVEEYNKLKEEEEDRILNGDNASGKVKINLDEIKSKYDKKYQLIITKKDEEIKNLSGKLKDKDSVINSTLIENEISKQMASGQIPVRDEFKQMLIENFRNKCFVEDDGTEKVVYIKDKTGDTPIATFFDYWNNSEEAKIYLKAEDTSGAGIKGNKGFKKTKSFGEMTNDEKVQLYNNNRAEYERLKTEK